MKAKRGSFYGLPPYKKLIIFRIPSNNSYKSTRRPFPPNFNSKFIFVDTK